ncbi:MAG: CBS domain-containing protein [Candidatus Sungbacteria bacterium]|uniref:CBS domain-containing protein n=1 Tax=Candidatus Sungiibacteriota bacterium TaxID=2750080 RepID=A0A9D6DNV6_9BACT|nr:CBS domain-containing protein [Candidatus Sungbacteria bacterium]
MVETLAKILSKYTPQEAETIRQAFDFAKKIHQGQKRDSGEEYFYHPVEVAKILRDTQSRHLIVLDNQEKPHGIISVVDINNRVVAAEKNPAALKAKDIMTKNILVVPCTIELAEALQKMSEKNISSLPVVDEKNKLLGVLEFPKALKSLCEFEKKITNSE